MYFLDKFCRMEIFFVMPGTYFSHSKWRTGKPDAVKTFVNVRSAGHYITYHDFRDMGGKKDFLEIFWCLSGEGHLLNYGKEVKMLSGDFFCYLPGSTHNIYSDSSWEYYWLTCDGPHVETLIRTFGLKQELRHIGPPPEELFNTVINALCNIDASEAIHASVAAYDILLRAVNPISRSASSQDIVERFKILVAQNYSLQEFSLQTAAASLGVHRSTLHRVFTAKSGISPQDYLISYRLQQALAMLDNNVNIHIKEVADACGFNAQHYFAKVFRKYFGKNPNEFRKDLIYTGSAPVKRISTPGKKS